MTNREILERGFEEVWGNPRQTATIEELMAPDCRLHGLGEAGSVDRETFKGIRASFLEAFPDMTIELGDVVSDGDRAAFHATVSGTHLKGDRSVEFQGCGLGRRDRHHGDWHQTRLLLERGGTRFGRHCTLRGQNTRTCP